MLSCHYDILSWLRPDWVFDTATGRYAGRWLRPRPPINLKIIETDWSWWPRFEPHHYLKLPKMIAATCYVGLVDDEPVAHVAVSTLAGLKEARACRLVVMPEWQGAGVGLRFLNAVCGAWRRGRNRYGKPMLTMFHSSHPGLAAALRRDAHWTQISAHLFGANREKSRASLRRSGCKTGRGFGGHFRAVQGFRYIEGDGYGPAPPGIRPAYRFNFAFNEIFGVRRRPAGKAARRPFLADCGAAGRNGPD